MGQSTTQVKVTVKSETASAFKEACKISNISMAGVLSQFMDQYSKKSVVKGGYAPDLASRRQRRAVVNVLIKQLERIVENEERCLSNIPDNLRESAISEASEDSIENLNDALESLSSAY